MGKTSLQQIILVGTLAGICVNFKTSSSELDAKRVACLLQTTVDLPEDVTDKVMGYLPTSWTLSGTCKVGFAYHGPHDFTSRRVALTNDGLISSSYAQIVHHDLTGNRREELRNWKQEHSNLNDEPSRVSHLVASEPLDDGSSYVAATIEADTDGSLEQDTSLKIWRIYPGDSKTEQPTVLSLPTFHNHASASSELVESLVFSPAPDVRYLAAAGYKNLTVLRRDKGSSKNEASGTFSIHLCLDPGNKDRFLPINLSFIAPHVLMSLYGDTMKHWKLGSKGRTDSQATGIITEAVAEPDKTFDPGLIYLIEQYADELAHSKEINSHWLTYADHLLTAPTGYRCAWFNLDHGHTGIELFDARLGAKNTVTLSHPHATNVTRRHADAVAYGPYGTIVGGFNTSDVVIWKRKKGTYKVEAVMQAKREQVKYWGISSVAISPDGYTIAAHDFSGLASIFTKKVVDTPNPVMPPQQGIACDF